MITPLLRLQELTRRLGVQVITREAMPLAEVVSPCITVGDLREHVPPILAPRALFGAAPATTVGNFAAAQVTCFAPGGAWVDAYVGALPGAIIRSRIQAGAVALTTSNACPAQNFGAPPCVSQVVAGDVAAAALLLHPAVFVGATVALPRVFLPAGSSLYLEHGTAGGGAVWCFNVQEFASQPGT